MEQQKMDIYVWSNGYGMILLLNGMKGRMYQPYNDSCGQEGFIQAAINGAVSHGQLEVSMRIKKTWMMMRFC
jgi:hypothetical protein